MDPIAVKLEALIEKVQLLDNKITKHLSNERNNINELKKTNELLKKEIEAFRKSEKNFAKAFNACPNPMSIYSFDSNKFVDINISYLVFSGYTRAEIVGKNIFDLGLFLSAEVPQYIKSTIFDQGKITNMDVVMVSKQGEQRFGLLSAELLTFNDEKCMLTVINDITERKQMETEMSRLDRLNLIGQMAAGIGHEIRNPMTTVRGFLQMLSSKNDYADLKNYFTLMIEELDRANDIITEYLSLAKKCPPDLIKQNLNMIIKAVWPLIESNAREMNMYLSLELGNIDNLLLEDKEIRQLLLNLVRNGLESMGPGGLLTIKTYQEQKDIILMVQDHGTGIPEDILEKLGTPFITNKEQGTGLGLAVCFNIITRHNAKLHVESSPAGTTFYIRFCKE
ncbi:two-component system sensor histidine kinase NtrB [Desulforamulus aquiferis]|uniref:histidine kinase n=1 Tax=Desulforamulus aquiferis TaxID=1397668 RepID=A0AAW7ZBE0_9FIRM|nr:PAS domain-containing sensor histidine kinase [Desulforamulus aquiferis]MDO7786090.1 ATP-binding protein [Desulforamulus aquiferis]